jgi:hypothetical protein
VLCILVLKAEFDHRTNQRERSPAPDKTSGSLGVIDRGRDFATRDTRQTNIRHKNHITWRAT